MDHRKDIEYLESHGFQLFCKDSQKTVYSVGRIGWFSLNVVVPNKEEFDCYGSLCVETDEYKPLLSPRMSAEEVIYWLLSEAEINPEIPQDWNEIQVKFSGIPVIYKYR